MAAREIARGVSLGGAGLRRFPCQNFFYASTYILVHVLTCITCITYVLGTDCIYIYTCRESSSTDDASSPESL